MLNGYAACLKTTLSYLLATALEVGHVSTSLFGPIVADRASGDFLSLREQRYTSANAATAAYLTRGTSVVVDGTFALRRWRESFYQTAREFGVQEVVAVTCICSDIRLLEERFRHRANNVDVPDAAAHSFSAYAGSMKEFEPLDHDEIPQEIRLSRLLFDSCSGTVQILKSGEKAIVVAELINIFIRRGMLAQPLFSSTSQEVQERRIVLLEGIGGSGKSTQAELLREPLGEYFGVNPLIRGEFSNSPLGRFIDTSRGDALLISPVEDPLAQNFLVTTDLMSCFLKPSFGKTVHILDSGILCRLAHMNAFRVEVFPVEAWRTLLETTSRVLKHLVIGNSLSVSIFLDVPVEVAIERLRSRQRKLVEKEREFLLRLDRAMRELIAQRPDVVIVDAVGAPEVVNKRIVAAVTANLCP